MKRVFTQILILICSAVFLGCGGRSEAEKSSGSVQVRLPWYSAKDGYKLEFVELSGLSSLQKVSGQFAQFFFSPGVKNGKLRGHSPSGRFLKLSGNKFAPGNEISQQMATIYAHLERFAMLDRELGADVNTWPRDVGVGVRISGGMVNNAFYDGKTDSMLFVPYSAEGLPIAVNAGILAHEHFHSLFNKIVAKSTNSEKSGIGHWGSVSNHSAELFYQALGIRDEAGELAQTESAEEDLSLMYHKVLVRGMNEGLADFWAWMYTGDSNFIVHSLPEESERRSLESRVLFFPSKNLLENAIRTRIIDKSGGYSRDKAERYLPRIAYEFGTQIARFVKSYTEVYSKARNVDSTEARKEVAKAVIRSLSIFRDDLINLKKGDLYLPENFVVALSSNITDMTKEECDHLSLVLENVGNTNLQLSCRTVETAP